jgi:hypothetical protein
MVITKSPIIKLYGFGKCSRIGMTKKRRHSYFSLQVIKNKFLKFNYILFKIQAPLNCLMEDSKI